MNALLAMADAEPVAAAPVRALDLLNGYAPVFLMAFVVTIVMTPIVRRLAVACDIIDKPDQTRKLHTFPIAYFGGLSVFLGVIAAILLSLTFTHGVAGKLAPVPLSVILGLLAITLTGLADDTWGLYPRLKISGQLIAAAALAIEKIGTRVAEGALSSWIGPADETLVTLGTFVIQNGDLYYWIGTAIIAAFVLGGCNAANLIDGLDGLLSGTVAIMMVGFLAVSLMMATAFHEPAVDDLAGARIVISLATLGAVLGFLPWNWNPAVIFLGDTGSLLLGYLCVVMILMFGEQGHTHLVLAGLIIFALPIMDTLLAIVRRKLAGVPFSTADSNHLHHLVRRSTGGVKSAVLLLYGITAAFSLVGATLAGLVIHKVLRFQIGYAAAIVLFGFVMAIAFKGGRRQLWETSMQSGQAAVPAEPGVTDRSEASMAGGPAQGSR